MAEKVGPSPTGRRQVTSAGPGDVRERSLKYLLPTKEPAGVVGRGTLPSSAESPRLPSLWADFRCHGLGGQGAAGRPFQPEATKSKKRSLSRSQGQ